MSDYKRSQALTQLARYWGLPLPGRIVICVLLVAVAAFSQSTEWVAKSEEAKTTMAGGRFKEAVSLYRELVKAFPDNPGLIMSLGLALHSASQYPEAILQFQSVVKVQPQLAGAWFLLGVDLQRLNRPSEAIQPLKRALQLDPRNRSAQLELADALLKSGRLSQAAEQFRSLTNLDETSAQAWMGLGIAYSSLAGQLFGRLENSFGDSAYIYMLVGQARADQLQHRSAYHCFRKALDLNASLTEAHQAIASIYRATGHPDWAAIEEQESPSASQADCTGSSLSCQFAEKRYEDLHTAAKNDRTAESYYWQVRAYTELAERSQARLTELPESAEIHQLIATLYDLRGLYLDAIREWK